MSLFILYFESANYCGYGHHAVVRAYDHEDAHAKASPYMEEYFMEQDQDQYIEEGGDPDDAVWSNMVSCEELGPTHEHWQYVIKPNQASFYEFIGVTQDELKSSMNKVFVVTGFDLGWDNVVGVFTDVSYEELLNRFPPESYYVAEYAVQTNPDSE